MLRCFALMLLVVSTVNALEAPLRVGIAEVDVSPVVGKDKTVFVAGFGHGRKATGVHDPIMVRAIVLMHGKQKIALACADVVGLFPTTVEAVREQLPGFDYVLVSATHNHEGPDTLGLWGSTPFKSGIDPEYMKKLQAGIVEAIKLAEKHAVEVTARIGTVNAPELLHDARLPIVLHDELVVIEFKRTSDKKPHGLLVQWNNHPETLDSKNTEISADFVAGAVNALKKAKDCPVAYFTGTVGGLMSSLKVPINGPDGKPLADGTFEKTETYGRQVADAALKALDKAQPITLTPFKVRTQAVHVPIDNTIYKLAWQIGVLDRPVYLREESPYPREPKLAVDSSTRNTIRTEVGCLSLGDLDVAAIPGEIYPELVLGKVQNPADKGADFPDAAIEPAIYKQLKGKHRLLIGLANDEIGYLIPKRQWDEQAPFCYGLKKSQYGEINSCGPETARIITEAFQKIAK